MSVCILHRDIYRVERLSVPSEGSALDSLWLSLYSVTAVIIGVVYRPPSASHGSSEGHEMLKRNDKCHSIADEVPIPKMYFLSKSVDGLFQKIALLCLTRYLFL